MTGEEEKVAVENAKKALEKNQFNIQGLKRKSEPIKVIDDKIKNWASILMKTMTEKRGSGIAAPQVGLYKRMIVYRNEWNKYVVLINPIILEQSKEIQIVDDSCLNFPGVSGKVFRPQEIKVKAINLDGKIITVVEKGIIAARLSHEIDHLDGILFVEKAISIKASEKLNEEHKELLKLIKATEGTHLTNIDFIIRMIEKLKSKQIINRDKKMTKDDNESEKTKQPQKPQTHSWDLTEGKTNGNNKHIYQPLKSEMENTSQGIEQGEHYWR